MRDRWPKVLLAYHHRPMCVGRFFRAAFAQAGCEVVTLGPYTPTVYGHEFHGEDAGPPNVLVEDTVSEIDAQQVLGLIEGWQPDAVVMVDQYDQFRLVGCVQSCRFAWVTVENWNTEQSERFNRRETDREYFMISHSDDAPLPPGAQWLTFGADPFVHPYMVGVDRDILVAQIGTPYSPRPEIWNYLRKELDDAPPVTPQDYGKCMAYTEHTAFGHAFGLRQAATVHNHARCVLSSSNVDFVPMRAPEAFAQGALLLSDDVPALRAAYGPPAWGAPDSDPDNGIWVVHNRTPESILETVKEVQHTCIRDIAERAYVRCMREHLYYHRALKILGDLGIEHPVRPILF